MVVTISLLSGSVNCFTKLLVFVGGVNAAFFEAVELADGLVV